MAALTLIQIVALVGKPLLIIVLAIIAQRLTVAGFRSLERRILAPLVAAPERGARIHTLIQLGQHTTNVVIVILASLMVLHVLGINILPLLTGAGVLGLAVSLGTQTLVRDVINGVFILSENQFEIGDVIRVGDRIGKVERMTLRVTYLRDSEGYLHIIPNGEIRVLSNLSRTGSSQPSA